MTAEDRLQTALCSIQPRQALRVLVQELAREGKSKAEIYGLLETSLIQFCTRPDFCDAHEDALLDVMDALTGWCHPNAELLPEKPVR